MLENSMTALSEQNEHDGFRFCWFYGSLQTLLRHDAINTSKIHSKFILCQKKHKFYCSHRSHICTIAHGKEIENF